MSFAEDRGFDGYDMDDFMQSDFRDNERTDKAFMYGIHIDGKGNEVDMRNVDKQYARNLYNLYLEKHSSTVKDSLLMQMLKTKGEC